MELRDLGYGVGDELGKSRVKTVNATHSLLHIEKLK